MTKPIIDLVDADSVRIEVQRNNNHVMLYVNERCVASIYRIKKLTINAPMYIFPEGSTDTDEAEWEED